MPIFAVLQAGKGSYGGQPVWFGDPDNPKPFTISNLATSGNIWIGNTQAIGPSYVNYSTPVTPGGYLSFDGTEPVYYVIADAPGVTCVVYPGVQSVFQTQAISSGGGTLGEDVSTPAIVHSNGIAGAHTAVSNPFSPPASSLLVVCVNIHGTVTLNTADISIHDTGNHTWAQRVAVAQGTCVSQIYETFLTTAPGSITLTIADSDVNCGSIQFSIRVVLNANVNQASSATSTSQSASSTNMNGSILTTQAGSWVYCCGNAPGADGDIALTGTTTIDDYVINTNTTSSNAIGRQSSPTGTPGATTLGWTNAFGGAVCWAALEVLHS